MNPETTLNAVRELSENAMLRPATKHLRLTQPEDLQRGRPRPAPEAYEELHPPRMSGDGGTAHDHRPRPPVATDHCSRCGKRPEYCYCDVSPVVPDWMQKAAKKAGSSNV